MRLIFLLAAIISACSTTFADDRHVVLITLDGFPAYLLGDPRAPIPTLRKLAAEGVWAEGMRVSNPSITWPNHTTLVTGVTPAKHSVLFNGVLVRDRDGTRVTIDPARDQSELVAVPTILDIAHQAGLTTAAINWPCTRNSASIDDNFPDVPGQIDFMTPRLKDELRADGILPVGTQQEWAKLSSPQWEGIWTEAACYVIRHRKPNLLLLHIGPDAVHHYYGPQTMAGYTACALADREVRDVLAALDDAGIRGQTAVIVTADHGFAADKKLVEPNVLLRKQGLLNAAPSGIVAGQVQVVSEGGTAFVYFSDPQTAAQLRDKVVKLFQGQEGIAEVITPDRYPGLGLPTPDKNPHIGDLLLAAQDGYAFAGIATGEDAVRPALIGVSMVGNHGYLSSNPKMNAVFIAAGRGIPKQKPIGVIDNTAVAPTAAALLGLQIPNAEGTPLSDVLTKDVTR